MSNMRWCARAAVGLPALTAVSCDRSYNISNKPWLTDGWLSTTATATAAAFAAAATTASTRCPSITSSAASNAIQPIVAIDRTHV